MGEPLRLFVIASAIPGRGQHATQMVLYETVAGMTALGHHVTLQVLVPEGSTLPADAPQRFRALSSLPGLEVLEPLAAPPARRGGRRVRRLLSTARRAIVTRLEELYPHALLGPEIERRLAAARADVVVIVWSTEGLAATFRISHLPKYAYYAMPEHLAPAARLRHPELFDIPTRSLPARARLALARRLNRRRERFHFAMIGRYEAVSDICAFHADLYAHLGHRHAVYLQNMWPDVLGDAWRERREAAEATAGGKVAASVGNVFATGNTFGLFYLGAEVLPELRRRLAPEELEIHVFGRGLPYARVASVLADPCVNLRGWVPDIDAELLSSKVFLVLNNAGYYRGAHTRFLHAWSLGGCVVAHRANGDGMPEIRHGENALLGDSPAEIADLVVSALRDTAMRRRLGENGRRTFERHFRSDVVVAKLLEDIRQCHGRWSEQHGGGGRAAFGTTPHEQRREG